MRPPTPNLSSILSSAAYIRDPSTSPTRLESPIDTIAQYLNIPDHQDSSSSFIKDEEDPDQQQQELTPTMQYATLASAYSPLLQHQREQQLQALQQQQCIPGLAQIYTPLPVTSFTPIPTSSSSQLLSARSPSAAYDEAELELDADDDYIPGASSSSRKRSSSPTRSTDSVDGNAAATASGAPPAPKRQRAAPSGPISTKDWVPPDVTGLNKREARLVKNRAAAFLSRQRKREEFEQMEMYVFLFFPFAVAIFFLVAAHFARSTASRAIIKTCNQIWLITLSIYSQHVLTIHLFLANTSDILFPRLSTFLLCLLPTIGRWNVNL